MSLKEHDPEHQVIEKGIFFGDAFFNGFLVTG